MNPLPLQFTVSLTEMDRRKRAYATLIISLFAGVTFSIIDVTVANPAVSIAALAGFALLLAVSGMYFNRLFRKTAGTTVLLDNEYLQRISATSIKRCPLDSIVRLWIKRTVKGTIRVVEAAMIDKTRIAINGLQEFEAFRTTLQERVRKDVVLIEFRELIDFDHPLYYVFFGLFAGVFAALFMRFLTILDFHTLKWIQLGIIGFVAAAGIFLIINRPLSRYGKHKAIADYLFGASVLAAGAAIAVYLFA
jgi:hypothetical protein